mmetsp:Transcript_2214/g.7288  ORF Transcript_2214/g.7288 Transcript_2214/m.7288 type:complete len:221 (+) Transcript_2214:95-757(+)
MYMCMCTTLTQTCMYVHVMRMCMHMDTCAKGRCGSWCGQPTVRETACVLCAMRAYSAAHCCRAAGGGADRMGALWRRTARASPSPRCPVSHSVLTTASSMAADHLTAASAAVAPYVAFSLSIMSSMSMLQPDDSGSRQSSFASASVMSLPSVEDFCTRLSKNSMIGFDARTTGVVRGRGDAATGDDAAVPPARVVGMRACADTATTRRRSEESLAISEGC